MSEESKTEIEKVEKDESDFAAMSEEPEMGLVQEFWIFLTENKKWWLTPILLVLALVAALVILGATPAAPFIYTLF